MEDFPVWQLIEEWNKITPEQEKKVKNWIVTQLTELGPEELLQIKVVPWAVGKIADIFVSSPRRMHIMFVATEDELPLTGMHRSERLVALEDGPDGCDCSFCEETMQLTEEPLTEEEMAA